ncbi:unnamed protein product [Moneuplotes crassus]|uniref:Uncharacterized protein n=1 Tax=Euplotes crassus TaxID=5936 RepID=A0AAD1ULZ3_EUPCR|nr:unnamed protein product [Moneuplotes crassus]
MLPSVSKPKHEESELIHFDLSTPEYDQDTYMGRFLTFLQTQNPLLTFATTSKIHAAQNTLAEYEAQRQIAINKDNIYKITRTKAKELREAQYLISSCVHPDTNKILAPWQRFCSYSVFNIPIGFGLLLCEQTVAAIIFWQCINQTYNAVLNYSNRNASSNSDTKGLLKAYCAAVICSITIGLLVKALLSPYFAYFEGSTQHFFSFLISLSACGSAGVANVLIMRASEMKEGIALTDAKGNEFGKSPIIGKNAVIKTALSRIFLPILPLLLPTLTFFLMETIGLVPEDILTKIMIESMVIFLSLSFAPPIGLAIFKQKNKVPVTGLEMKFHNLVDSDGKRITELYYNKGL